MNHDLTEREVQVLALIAAGLTDREIGTRLGIARSTVSNHVTVVLLKLSTRNRAEAAAVWVRRESAHEVSMTR